MTPFFPGLFDLRGVAFAGWTLAAFAIGALAGMLIRRVVPAIVAALAVYAGLVFAIGGFLRQHYLTPLLTSNPNVPGSAWIFSQWWTKSGTFAFAAPPDSLLNHFCSSLPSGSLGKPSQQTLFQCLSQHGYTRWTSYQPASRFWPSSGSRAAGCSRCRCCSSPPPSGWSAAGDLKRLPATALGESNPGDPPFPNGPAP